MNILKNNFCWLTLFLLLFCPLNTIFSQVSSQVSSETPEGRKLRESLDATLVKVQEGDASIFAKAQQTEAIGDAFKKALDAINKSLVPPSEEVGQLSAAEQEIEKMQKELAQSIQAIGASGVAEAEKVAQIEGAVEQAQELKKEARYAGYALTILAGLGGSVGVVLMVLGVTAPAGLGVIIMSITLAVKLVGVVLLSQRSVAKLNDAIKNCDPALIKNPTLKSRINTAVKEVAKISAELDIAKKTIDGAKSGLESAKKSMEEASTFIQEKISSGLSSLKRFLGLEASEEVKRFTEAQKAHIEQIRAEARKKFRVSVKAVLATVKLNRALQAIKTAKPKQPVPAATPVSTPAPVPKSNWSQQEQEGWDAL